jgi:hypothetical protein
MNLTFDFGYSINSTVNKLELLSLTKGYILDNIDFGQIFNYLGEMTGLCLFIGLSGLSLNVLLH